MAFQSWFGWGAAESNPAVAYAAQPPPAAKTHAMLTQPALNGFSGVHTTNVGALKVGEEVEYFSSSIGKWIPAKIVAINMSGNYDLDCKPDVLAEKIRRPALSASTSSSYQVGEVVEYFGASQQKWIPAKVLAANPNGTYNLDCKPDVPPEKIRKMGGQAAYKAGDVVEYFGASQNKWIPAKVLSANADGTFDLDCKPGVTADKIRRPAAAAPAAAGGASVYKVGDTVEYFGASLNKWIPAKVLAVNPNGTYDLDCKPGVGMDKIRPIPSGVVYSVGDMVDYYGASQGRWISAKVTRVNPSGTYDLDCKQDVAKDKIRPFGSGVDYKVGDMIEYFGVSMGKWIAAKVTAVNTDGTYDLDCKPAVPRDRVRAPGGGASYKVGAQVEYFGASVGKWIPAKVVAVNSNGTYNLDCKQDVTPDKIRLPGAADAPLGSSLSIKPKAMDTMPPGGGESASWSVGDSVEYYGASAGKWIPAKVLSVNTNGTFDLDCKPGVAPEKIRAPSSTIGSTLSNSFGTVLHLNPSAEPALYKKGDVVEYYGASLGKWIPATVLTANANGTYDLDCKPGVQLDKIRPSQGEYKVGELVEYSSATHGWIAAKVQAVNAAKGTYDLDCKPDVSKEKIRRAAAVNGSAVNGDTLHTMPAMNGDVGTGGVATTYAAGESVEYFGQSQNRWIPAKVLKANADGSYDLDCKPQVPADRVRRPVGSAATLFQPPTRPMTAVAPHDPSAPPPADAATPVQLLRAHRVGKGWRYEVCPDAATLLEQYGGRRIAITTVCGSQRAGKSTLLNVLSERSQRGLSPFPVAAPGRPGTQGLWMWCSLDSSGPADKMPGSTATSQPPVLAWFDCEGMGSAGGDATRDAQLLALCVLFSSVLLMNTKGMLDDASLSGIAPASRFAEHIEERGNEASKPSLLWLLRDVAHHQLVDAKGMNLAPDEYLEHALHNTAGNQQQQTRREVRQNLLRFFSQRNCATFVPPAEGADLGRLESMPVSSLNGSFRAEVEALRTEVLKRCRTSPKAVGGQPLSCTSFVTLLRQLVTALNDGRLLSVRGAWETVQHTSCGQLSEELRAAALQSLHALSAGQRLPDGSQLPLTDDALRIFFRSQRHARKAQWDARAVGDEQVRAEYWQELKESLAREENLLRQANTKLADKQLKEALYPWQEWLDDEKQPASRSQGICQSLGSVMERMPAGPLARAVRLAISAASRYVASAKRAVEVTTAEHREQHEQVLTQGEQAAQRAGAVRSDLGAKKSELQEAAEKLVLRQRAVENLESEFGARSASLQETKEKLDGCSKEAEELRTREHELRAKFRVQADSEETLNAALERLRADAAKSNADRLAAERCARTAADAAAAEKRRLEVELDQAKSESERLARQLADERNSLRDQSDKQKAEHAQRVADVKRQLEEEHKTLHGEKERTKQELSRMLDDTHKQLADERSKHTDVLRSEQDRLMDRERRAGVLEGQVQALTSETARLREQVKELEDKKRQIELHPQKLTEENARHQAEIEKARAEVVRIKAEAEERLQAQQAEHERKMAEEQAAREEAQKAKKGGLFGKGKKKAAAAGGGGAPG
eukprot:TRINITY_DN39546_c0_g1_i1.p1 TRINITY_DN39546_c0_g1~~TRINITY_DN39546_c0_g1_i1.p1  ORF type:complete len:1572 (+),score=466.03 TRINITY_DN39546_c0_g1_i1:140-4855(+)